MDKEFLGIGRTWFLIYIIVAGVTTGWLMNKITFDQWWQTVVPLTGIGGGKSGLEKITKGFGKK